MKALGFYRQSKRIDEGGTKYYPQTLAKALVVNVSDIAKDPKEAISSHISKL